MHAVLASALPEKPVHTTDGRELGTVHNLTVDPRAGSLETLIVETDRSDIDEVERTDDGHLRIPAEAISGFDDHLMVSLSE